MIIPYTLLEPATLRNLIEEFVSRDGTDNGYDQSLDSRVKAVLALLKKGDAEVVFDETQQSTNIVLKTAS
ncbi:YheU family protein [Candidatus Sororendozoicomonas aggregata]|uniref:YheU family protein n=1 Tax=Candidatus Sororendozoicomonas aggregata TaxID=3073239 RepID=UPI002ED6679D